MALRAAAMNSTESAYHERKPNHLLRRWILLWLLVSAYALVMVWLDPQTLAFPFLLLIVISDGVLGLVAGLSTRWLLSRRNWLVRTITAALTILVGLSVLGYFTDYEFGLQLYYLSHGYIRWADLFHLVFGIFVTWASLWAWHHPAPRRVGVTPSARPAARSAARPAPSNPRLRARSRASGGAPNQGITLIEPRIRSGSRRSSRPSVRGRANRRSPFARRPQVQLALVEDHRCPYCLEPVKRNDPRGVKECEICHTLHHAECWEITGSCQVPHLNS